MSSNWNGVCLTSVPWLALPESFAGSNPVLSGSPDPPWPPTVPLAPAGPPLSWGLVASSSTFREAMACSCVAFSSTLPAFTPNQKEDQITISPLLTVLPLYCSCAIKHSVSEGEHFLRKCLLSSSRVLKVPSENPLLCTSSAQQSRAGDFCNFSQKLKLC